MPRGCYELPEEQIMPSYLLKCEDCGHTINLFLVPYDYAKSYVICSNCGGRLEIKPQLFSNHFKFTRGE